MKGTIIDLGSAKIKVVGEDKVHQMQVASSSCIAVEIHRDEFEEWHELVQAPVRLLKKAFALSNEDVIHTWGRKAYRQGKLQTALEQADSVFIMLRIRESATDSVLRLTIPGLYASPRLESGAPDHNYKVIWCGGKSISDLRILAQSTQGCLGVVKSRSGAGLRVKCGDFSSVKAKLFPEWTPQQDTPYDMALPLRYELHHVHPAACREDLQRLLNEVQWKALVIRQARPKQWQVVSQSPPPRDTIFGCILVLPSQFGSNKGVGKGKAQTSKGKGKGPEWLLGSHTPSHAPPSTGDQPKASVGNAWSSAPPGDPQGPVKKAMMEVEQKMEERLASMRQEAATTHKLMRQDIQNMRDEFKEQAQQQSRDVKAVAERVDGIEANLSSQLSTFMSSLNSTWS